MSQLTLTNIQIDGGSTPVWTTYNTASASADFPYDNYYRSNAPTTGYSTTAYTFGRNFYNKSQNGTQTLVARELIYNNTSQYATSYASGYYQVGAYHNNDGTEVQTSYMKLGNYSQIIGVSSGANSAPVDRIVLDYSYIKPVSDGTINLGFTYQRFGTVYAVTGTISTSDQNEKEQIQELSVQEKNVAVAIKGLIKRYKWKSSVAEKGENARIHVGVMSQEVRDAFIQNGLDPGKYGLFCRDEWWEKEEINSQKDHSNPEHSHLPDMIIKNYDQEVPGSIHKERLGVRYDELLAFVIAAM